MKGLLKNQREFLFSHTHARTHTCEQSQAQLHAHAHMHTHTHTHTHTHIIHRKQRFRSCHFKSIYVMFENLCQPLLSAWSAEEPGITPLCSLPIHWDIVAVPVATLPEAWPCKISSGTGWPEVTILGLGEMAGWIYNSLASHLDIVAVPVATQREAWACRVMGETFPPHGRIPLFENHQIRKFLF